MPCDFAAFRFCCPTGCVYESDTFDRADNTALGAKWTETVGDWSISTNRLAIASASAKVTCTTLAPASSLKYLVSVSITLGTDGDVARVYVDDSAFFAELERITSTCGRLRLYDGAVCKGSVGVALGGYTRIVMCVEAAKVHVGTGGSPMLTVPATPASSIVALGTGACTGTVYFEDFSLSKHADDDATCPACGNEGCVWFSDCGCSSGSVSAADYAATGTWSYAAPKSGTLVCGRMRCSADGMAIIAVANPGTSGKVNWTLHLDRASLPNCDVGTTVRFALDDSDTYLEAVVYDAGGYPPRGWRVRLVSGGVAYGYALVTGSYGGELLLRICYDGAGTIKAEYAPFLNYLGTVLHTVVTLSPRITVSGLGAGQYVNIGIDGLTKSPSDISGCLDCAADNCQNCSPGTFTNSARVVLANLTSVDYGCACTDVTIPLTASASGCAWTGSVAGPCSSGTWTATATVSAVSGGYKLSVSVSDTTGVSALFEKTYVTGSLPDCSAVFDGDIPRVSSAGSLHCTLEAATCTFASPSP
jgi:hypothetical protein